MLVKILTICAVVIVIGSIMISITRMGNSEKSTPTIGVHWTVPGHWTSDGKFISVMSNISKLIPRNESLATTFNVPEISYFTKHTTIALSKKTLAGTLSDFMEKRNLEYLMVVHSSLKGLKPYNNPIKKADINDDFTCIANYTTDYLKIRICKLHASSL
jgi:hypothetical protein